MTDWVKYHAFDQRIVCDLCGIRHNLPRQPISIDDLYAQMLKMADQHKACGAKFLKLDSVAKIEKSLVSKSDKWLTEPGRVRKVVDKLLKEVRRLHVAMCEHCQCKTEHPPGCQCTNED